jgi:hypothetical protein
MVDSAANREPEARKRRSTRIAQAVPVTVTGVDALGRPFQERTSTLTINCHGCRYQSKHYVLKNMWVSLEVPHPEPARPPRTVRGRVTWIQRPRTVRELFQIGVELEIPGNFWGIAFPPADWFPFPDSSVTQTPAEEAERGVSVSESEPLAEQEPAPGNLVQMAANGATEASLNLARQAAKLVTEAKQQIQAAVRETTSKIVAQEARHILQAVEAQLSDAAGKAIHVAADQYAKHWLERADERIEQQARAAAESLREKWDHELDSRLEVARNRLAASVSSTQQAEQQTFEVAITASVESALSRLKESAESATARAEAATGQLERARREFEESVEQARGRLEQMVALRVQQTTAKLEEIRDTANSLAQQVRDGLAQADSDWRARAEAAFSAAQASWDPQLALSADQAAEAAASRAVALSLGNLKSAQAELSEHLSAFEQDANAVQQQASRALQALHAEIQQQAERARAAAAEIDQAAARVSSVPQQLEAFEHASARRLEQRVAELLESFSREMNLRVESAVEGLGARLQPGMDTAAAESAARAVAQVESAVASQLERAAQTVAQLSSAQLAGEEVLRAHQNRLLQASEQLATESAAQMQREAQRLEKEHQEANRAALEKSLAEVEARATDVTHNTIEALYKSASWYEKKVQTQMQGALEKYVQDATEALRFKAGEISSLFGSELDRYSRSFLDQARTQIDEVAQEAVTRSRQQVGEASEQAVVEGTSRARQAAQLELQRFTAGMRNAFDESVALLEAHTVQVRSRMSTDARQLGDDFQKSVAQQSQTALTSAQSQLEAASSAAQESLRVAREAQERSFEQALTAEVKSACEEALAAFKVRLEAASNAWLLSSAAALDQGGRHQLEDLLEQARQTLRGVFTQTFSEMGVALHDRLASISAAAAERSAPPAPPSPEPGPAGETERQS